MNEAVREEAAAAAWMELLNLWLNAAFYGIFMAIVVQYIILLAKPSAKELLQVVEVGAS